MVYLVGAGPGDSGLITVKGMECIKAADVVIFDHLVSGTLLNYASHGCKLIYAGKISGNHHLRQEETTALIIDHAKQGKNVVRLKGGDPTVFGRGGEEAAALARGGISFEIVPGISSCYSVPAYAGIPVTHRDYASSFHVITGHEKKGKDTIDYGALAKIEGTLVFLMGAAAISEIARRLIENGKDAGTPAAVISNGTLQNQTRIIGTLADIAEKAKNCPMPAVIVVGDVVSLCDKIEWFGCGALFGKRILATGTEAVLSNLRRVAGGFGGSITELSIIKTVPINYEMFSGIDLSDYTYIVFSSAGGVNIFFDYLANLKIDIRILSKIKFAVIGAKTAEALANRGIYADCVPEKADSSSLAAVLRKELTESDNVLLLRAEEASEVVLQMLENEGIPFLDLALYRTETDFSKREALNVYAKETDYIILSSGSVARAFSDLMESETSAKFISIGAQTTVESQKYGIEIYKTARNASAEDIIKSVLED
ncbi:MAG: uroporphyrinogen-III C-methyltransferase [Oscillospiraceae bacterium]|nr:uroporphyrinogen-III C-methyltransferase [Oscillospiraceae bacterium]